MKRIIRSILCAYYAKKIRDKIFWTLSVNNDDRSKCFLHVDEMDYRSHMMRMNCDYTSNYNLTRLQRFFDKYFKIFK